MRNLMILTATIRPPDGASGLVRVDPETRMVDYLQAFDFYLDRLAAGTFDEIVFVDNSNSKERAARIGEAAHSRGLGERVEVVSYFGLDYPPAYGRTYGEFKLIDDAYELSRTLVDRSPGDVVWKMTGRYTCRNIDKLVRRRPTSADFYCNCRNYPKRYVDTYLLAWTDRGYQGFVRGIYPKLRVDQTRDPGETLMWPLIEAESAANRLTIVPRFNVVPRIHGVRGFDNRPFHARNEAWKYAMRVGLNWTIPWVWI